MGECPSDQLRTEPSVGLLPIAAGKEPKQGRKVVGFAHLGPGGGNYGRGVRARKVDQNVAGMLGDYFRQGCHTNRRPCGFYDLFAVDYRYMAPIAPSYRPNEDSPGKI